MRLSVTRTAKICTMEIAATTGPHHSATSSNPEFFAEATSNRILPGTASRLIRTPVRFLWKIDLN